MSAIAGFDDVHAWLIRGFIEAGVPDHTGGGVEWTRDGAMNLDHLFKDRLASGILLQLVGQAFADRRPEDEATYEVLVVRDAGSTSVVVRCPETLFEQAFPALPLEDLAARVLAHVRHHSEHFTQWRRGGGETSWAERAAIAQVRGASCERGLATLLEKLRRERKSLSRGPAEGWWGAAAAPRSVSQAITTGEGRDPVYQTRPRTPEASTPENLEYMESVRTVGLVMLVLSGVSAIFVCAGFGWSGFTAWSVGFRGLYAQGWTVMALFANLFFVLLQLVCGLRLRAVRSLTLVRVLAVAGMLPCFAPCCLTGFPVGAWALLVLRSPRARIVFQ